MRLTSFLFLTLFLIAKSVFPQFEPEERPICTSFLYNQEKFVDGESTITFSSWKVFTSENFDTLLSISLNSKDKPRMMFFNTYDSLGRQEIVAQNIKTGSIGTRYEWLGDSSYTQYWYNQGNLNSKTQVVFDKHGNELERHFYSHKDDFKTKSKSIENILIYDKNDNLTREIYDRKRSYTITKYRHVIKGDFTYKIASIGSVSWRIDKLNRNGKPVTVWYSSEKLPKAFKKNVEIIEEHDHYKILEYEYDKFGNWTSETRYKSNVILNRKSRIFEYDTTNISSKVDSIMSLIIEEDELNEGDSTQAAFKFADLPYYQKCKSENKLTQRSCTQQETTAFIQQNINIPTEYQKRKYGGKTTVMYDIDQKGLPCNVRIIKTTHEEIGKAVIEVIKKLPASVVDPKFTDNPTVATFTIPINFKF